MRALRSASRRWSKGHAAVHYTNRRSDDGAPRRPWVWPFAPRQQASQVAHASSVKPRGRHGAPLPVPSARGERHVAECNASWLRSSASSMRWEHTRYLVGQGGLQGRVVERLGADSSVAAARDGATTVGADRGYADATPRFRPELSPRGVVGLREFPSRSRSETNCPRS
jgi:hypothetical protein